MQNPIGLSTLEDICELILHSHDLDQTLRNIVRLVVERMGTEVCSVYLLEQDHLVLRATEGLADDSVGTARLRPGEGLIGYAAQTREVVNAAEPESHPRFRYIAGSNEERYHSFLGIPLYDRQSMMGVMAIQSIERREFSRDEVSALTTIGFQLSTVIANARLLDSVSRSAQQNPPDASAIDRSAPEILSVLSGTPVTPGVAIAPAFVFTDALGFSDIAEETETVDVEAEKTRLQEAIEKTRVETLCLEKQVASRLSESDASIFHAHLMILQDQNFLEKVDAFIEAGRSSSSSLRRVVDQYVEAFRKLEDPFLRERALDVEDIGRRILANLRGAEQLSVELHHPGVIVAKELMPSQVAMLPIELVEGIVLECAQANSHATIVARSMGIPTVVGVEGAMSQIEPGTPLILDAGCGRLYVEPDENVKSEYHRLLSEQRRQRQSLERFRGLPAKSHDGLTVKMSANVGLLSDLELAKSNGADGVGLYRTEFPFMARKSFPTREEQCALYRRAIESFEGQSVTFRTLDIGGDKHLPYFATPEEENPTLGWRSIRVSLAHREIFQTQLEAILMASQHGQARILFPMVTTMDDWRACVESVENARIALQNEGLHIPMPPLGAMVEAPATISIARHIAKSASFFALGTNDLIQYVLAADRGNDLVRKYYDPLHPAVLDSVNRMIHIARDSKRSLCICGEMASDPECFVLLLGLGLREFSVSAPTILRLKEVLSRTSQDALTQLAANALAAESGSDARRMARQFLDSLSDASDR